MTKFLQSEYVMAFLMGLNDNFNNARSQVLLMDQIPRISKVFSLVTQEEIQRSIGVERKGSDSSNALAMTVRDESHKKVNNKERPVCTHCKVLGHIVKK